MPNQINLNPKKFKFTGAEIKDGQMILTLQYGSQIGKLSVDAEHQYAPQDLYKFTELLDQLLASVSVGMFKQEIQQDKDVLDSLMFKMRGDTRV